MTDATAIRNVRRDNSIAEPVIDDNSGIEF